MTKNLWIGVGIAAIVGLAYFGPTRSYIMDKLPSLPSVSLPWKKTEPVAVPAPMPEPFAIPIPEPEAQPEPQPEPSWRDFVKIPELPPMPKLPWQKRHDSDTKHVDDSVKVDDAPVVKHTRPQVQRERPKVERHGEHCNTTNPLEHPREAFDRAKCYGD